MVNLPMVPGVNSAYGHWDDNECFVIMVDGGNKLAIAKMISQCVSEDISLNGETSVEIDGRVIHFTHTNPDESESNETVKALPLSEENEEVQLDRFYVENPKPSIFRRFLDWIKGLFK